MSFFIVLILILFFITAIGSVATSEKGSQTCCGCLFFVSFICIFFSFFGVGGVAFFIGALFIFSFFTKDKLANGKKTNEEKCIDLDRIILCIFAKIAKADGKVDQEEALFIKRIVAEMYSNYSADWIQHTFNEARDNNVSYKVYAQDLARMTRGNETIQRSILAIFCELAAATNTITQAEIEILHYIENLFNIDGYVDAYFLNSKSDKTISLEESYEILGCRNDAADREVQRAYRAKCKEFHPDILTGKGASPRIIEEAKKEQQRINMAYENIKKYRGFK